MLLIVVEDDAIARPLIDTFALVRKQLRARVALYTSVSTTLVVSGQGPLEMAAATAYALGGALRLSEVFAVGVSRCKSVSTEKGGIAVVNRVVHEHTGESFIPDILVDHGLPEITVVTRAKDLVSPLRGVNVAEAVDRSLAGFFASCARFIGPHQTLALGIRLENDAEGVPPELGTVVRSISSGSIEAISPHLPSAEGNSPELVEELVQALRLTRAQEIELRRIIGELLARGRIIPAAASGFARGRVSTKQEAKRQFNRLKALLESDPLLQPGRPE